MTKHNKTRDTKERLLAVGVTVLVEHGYNGAGIKQIVDAAGVPKGSFYNYFESKEHFSVAVVERYAADLLARLDAIVANADGDPLGAIRRYFTEAADSFEAAGVEDGCLLCNMGAEVPAHSRICRQAMQRAFDAEHKRLTHLAKQHRRLLIGGMWVGLRDNTLHAGFVVFIRAIDVEKFKPRPLRRQPVAFGNHCRDAPIEQMLGPTIGVHRS